MDGIVFHISLKNKNILDHMILVILDKCNFKFYVFNWDGVFIKDSNSYGLLDRHISNTLKYIAKSCKLSLLKLFTPKFVINIYNIWVKFFFSSITIEAKKFKCIFIYGKKNLTILERKHTTESYLIVNIW